MPTTKELYGREGTIEIRGIKFSPKMRHEAKCDSCSKEFTEEEFFLRKVSLLQDQEIDRGLSLPGVF
ncbi:MAG: hypothetical protein PHC95_05070 [Parabacteroides sp.]|nr:hypothetical protein [Parabacteroides sp.]